MRAWARGELQRLLSESAGNPFGEQFDSEALYVTGVGKGRIDIGGTPDYDGRFGGGSSAKSPCGFGLRAWGRFCTWLSDEYGDRFDGVVKVFAGGHLVGYLNTGSLGRSASAGTGAARDWTNVYVLRQEYNSYQKCWFPIIFYWNGDGDRHWVEALCTETGSSYYTDEPKSSYESISRRGTDKCSPEDVKAIVSQYEAGAGHAVYEVSKLNAYVPGRG